MARRAETDTGSRSTLSARADSLTVVICTLNRPAQLARTLEALDRQSDRDFDLFVVDQSDPVNPELASRQRTVRRFRVIRDDGRGVSRARNLGWRTSAGGWVAFLDDDCLPDPDWSAAVKAAIAAHPEASLISGEVRERASGREGYRVATVDVGEERVLSGRRLRPDAIGLGVSTIRRQWLQRLGGYDERLGPGVADFPAGEDVDFNYRFLRAEGVAFVTPRIRIVHEQVRPASEQLPMWSGYYRGWAAFTIKQLRGGDVLGALMLWAVGLRVIAGVVWGSLRMRSMFQLRRAGAMLFGLLAGTLKAAARSW